MRDQLIGYLLDALEPDERSQVEEQLSRDPELRQDLHVLSRAFEPLAVDRNHYEAPPGLVDRTFQYIAAQTETRVAAPAFARGRFSMTDMLVAAGIFVAATMLFFPALNQSRFAARVNSCQNNLRQLGVALANYSSMHNGHFPHVPQHQQFGVAGIYATLLVDHGFLTEHRVLICPSSRMAEQARDFRVPTMAELRSAAAHELEKMHERMGGSYGYNLGYVEKGNYKGPKNLQRHTFAIAADTPGSESAHTSPNHLCRGQNVLFEDGHVQYLTTCKARGCVDDIFVNDDGKVAAGLHVDDAVIGHSHDKPIPSGVKMGVKQ